jgi:hypothetical protein
MLKALNKEVNNNRRGQPLDPAYAKSFGGQAGSKEL